MYREILRVDNIHMQSGKYDLMSKPISFTIMAGSLSCIISRDFNIRYFLRRCISGGGLPYKGRIYVDGERRNIGSVREAHSLGIYEANLTDLFSNMDVGLNITIPDIPMYGLALAHRGSLYDEIKTLLDEFEITDIDPHMLCGSLNDFQKQLVMLLRSYMRGAKLIMFNFFANYSYSEDELVKLADIFSKLRERNVTVLCFSSGWLPESLSSFDRYILIEENVIVKNVGRSEFSPSDIGNGFKSFAKGASLREERGEVVLSCRDFPYGEPEERKTLSFELRKKSCLGILDPQRELLALKDILSGKRRGGLENRLYCGGVPLFKNKKLLDGIALLDYGFEETKSFEKLSLYDNITAGVGGAMYKLGFVFSARIQKFIVSELLVAIERQDLLELYGQDDKKLDNLDPEDQFVVEICRRLCVKPRAFVFHNFGRNYSLLSSEKVGSLISKLNTKFGIPVLIIAPGHEELNFFCSEIVKL